MATNPMQRKSRNAFLLGMIITLLIAAAVVALLYMKISNQKKELEKYETTTREVYVLNQDVTSGQILTPDMFKKQLVSESTIPNDATLEIASMLANAKLVDTEGRTINAPNIAVGKNYYYYKFEGTEEDSIIYTGNDQPVTILEAGDKAYYYAGTGKTQKTEIEVEKVTSVIAKIDMKANTVITRGAITTSDEKTTDDLREQEYNVIGLPVDLMTGDYVDIRLMLPNGQNYIVVSKKQVTVPMANGAYLADTIKINLTEEEITMLSGAILENYKIEGSKLYANKYKEAGLQEAAQVTYYPSSEVTSAMENNPNLVRDAINGIIARKDEIRKNIDNAANKYGDEDNVSKEMEESEASALEDRQKYLQSMTGTVAY